MLPQPERPLLTHQTGTAQHEKVRAAYAEAQVEAEVLPFIDNMSERLALCDVIVCRAGAVTVSELCAAGVASVLVPLVVSTTSHQRDNAQWMAKQGAGIHLPQTELTPQRLAEMLKSLTRDALLNMATKARALARPRRRRMWPMNWKGWPHEARRQTHPLRRHRWRRHERHRRDPAQPRLHRLGLRPERQPHLAPPGLARHQGVRRATTSAHIAGAEAVVTSTAVKSDNPEVIAARARRVPVVPRAVMLAELMRLKRGIAIAGTHGKTTTTSLVTSVLAEAGLDPTFVIGGKLNAAGANSRLGSGDYIVVEADESDASFLNLMPILSVVTNIDADHMDTYGHDLTRLKGAFVEFLHRMPFYGAAILCGDDPGVRSIIPMVSRPVITYGFGPDAQVRAVNVQALVGGQMRFTAQRRNGVVMPDLEITLNLPGEHNVLNALAAVAVATELELPDAPLVKALGEFHGVGRRFQRYGELQRAQRRHVHADRRLRPPPGRDGRGDRGGARRLPGPPPGDRLPAAPLHPHARLLRRLRQGDGHGRRGAAGRGLCRRRSRRSWRPMAARWRARCAWPARSTRSSWTRSRRCPTVIAEQARDGDVVIAMGAGTIGAVAGQVAELLKEAP